MDLFDVDFTDVIFWGDDIRLKGGEQPGLWMPGAELQPILQELGAAAKSSTASYVEFRQIRFRIARKATEKGPALFLRRPPARLPELQDLGIAEPVIERMLQAKDGLMIISGPQGDGKTTTASAVLKSRLVRRGGHAVTIEAPPEHRLEGWHGEGACFQEEVAEDKFGEAIAESYRQAAPDLIFIGEVRRPVAAEQALLAALNGNLVLFTFHASGVKEALDRFISMSDVEHQRSLQLVASSLALVWHQRLVRLSTGKKMLQYEFLFPDDGIRAKIREDRIHQLTGEIDAQRNKLARR